MTKYLARKCPRCDNIVKIIETDGNIDHLDHLTVRLLWPFKVAEPGLRSSEKTVRCCHLHPHAGFEGILCYKIMRISAFKEVKM